MYGLEMAGGGCGVLVAENINQGDGQLAGQQVG